MPTIGEYVVYGDKALANMPYPSAPPAGFIYAVEYVTHSGHTVRALARYRTIAAAQRAIDTKTPEVFGTREFHIVNTETGETIA